VARRDHQTSTGKIRKGRSYQEYPKISLVKRAIVNHLFSSFEVRPGHEAMGDRRPERETVSIVRGDNGDHPPAM